MQTDTIIHDHATFRVLLNAMSRPASVCALPRHGETTGHALLAEMLRCLMDQEVTYYVMGDAMDAMSREISRSTGSSGADVDTADFLIFPQGTSGGALSAAKRGTLEYPDTGATAVFLVERLAETGGEATLTGPGINGILRPAIHGLAPGELEALGEVNAEFPLGLDALFLDTEGRIMAIPRSTRIGRN